MKIALKPLMATAAVSAMLAVGCGTLGYTSNENAFVHEGAS